MDRWREIGPRRYMRACSLHGTACVAIAAGYDEGAGRRVWLLRYGPAESDAPTRPPGFTTGVWLGPFATDADALRAATARLAGLGTEFPT